MIAMNEAVQIVMDDTSQLDTTTVSLLESLGHTLAKDVVSDINMPPFEKATMDGYALVANDVTSASRFNPVTLDLVEEIQAGMVPSKTVSAGQASRIMTGAPVPSGADAVIMVEDTAFENGVLQVFEPIEPGRNRVPLGEDVRKGQTVLTAPRRIRSTRTNGVPTTNCGCCCDRG